MKIERWLADSMRQLQAADIPSARLDCLILLEDALGKDRSWILAHPEAVVDQKVIKTVAPMLQQRAQHLPLAYIRHTTEFYGRNFYIDESVLEPRPESETMIEILMALELSQKPDIVDVGTGSGAIAITAKLELPNARVAAIDIDPACLQVARRNAKTHEVDISFHQTNLLETYDGNIDVILANLPYVPDSFTINPAAMNEPRIAIFGGPDGLDLYRQMFGQIAGRSAKPRYVLTEALPPQHPALADIALSADYRQRLQQDFIQLFELTA